MKCYQIGYQSVCTGLIYGRWMMFFISLLLMRKIMSSSVCPIGNKLQTLPSLEWDAL